MAGNTEIHQANAVCGCGLCAAARDTLALPGRRRVLQAGLAVAGLAALGGGLMSRAAQAQSTLSPDQALAQLLEGNERFVAKKMTSFDEDLAILKANTASKQEPFAAVLSCADSRVPVELVFDQSIGHVFVTRVAGNMATTEIIASLEYGAAVLGTKAILVMGHSNCGALKATIDGKAVPGQISSLYAPLRAAVDAAGTDLTAAIKANARIQAELLSHASPVLAGLIKEKKLMIAAGYYDLASGTVEQLG